MPKGKKKEDTGCEATPVLKDLGDLAGRLKTVLPAIKVKNIKAFYDDYSKPPPPPPPPAPEPEENEEVEEIKEEEPEEEDSDIIESSDDESLIRRAGKPREKQQDGCCTSKCQVTCKKLPREKKIRDQKAKLEEMLYDSYKNTKNTQEYFTPTLYHVREPPVAPLRQTESGRQRQCVGPAGGAEQCKTRSKAEHRFGIKQFKTLFPLIIKICDPDPESEKVAPEVFFGWMVNSGLRADFTIDLCIKLLDTFYEEKEKEDRKLTSEEVMFACQNPKEYIKVAFSPSKLEEALNDWGEEFKKISRPPNEDEVENKEFQQRIFELDDRVSKLDMARPRFDQTLRRASGAARLHHNLETFKVDTQQPSHVNMMDQFVKFKREMDDNELLRDHQDSPYAVNNMLREMNSLARQRAVFEDSVEKDRRRKLRNLRLVRNQPLPEDNKPSPCNCHNDDNSPKTACQTRAELKEKAKDFDL